MKISRSVVVAVVVAAGIVSGVAMAGFGGRNWRGRARDPQKVARLVEAKVDNLMDDLEATPQQRAKAKALAQQLVQEGMALRTGRESTREELRQAWTSNTPDKARVYALVDQRADEFKAFAKKAVDAAFELHQTLTPAQRAELSEELDGMFHHGMHP